MSREWQPGAPTVLAVVAHPDDETLTMGGLLSACAEADWNIAVLTCTRGEAGDVIGEDLAHLAGDGPALAAHRERELAAALAALGVQRHYWLDEIGEIRIVDSGMIWGSDGEVLPAPDAPENALSNIAVADVADRMASILSDALPDVVVSEDPGGGYGHPDHVRVVEGLMITIGMSMYNRPMWLWAHRPAEQLRAGLRALAAYDAGDFALPDPDGPLPPIADDHKFPRVVVDVAGVRQHVLAAMQAHASQIQAIEAIDGNPDIIGRYALSNGMWYPMLAKETYQAVFGHPDLVSWPTEITVEPAP